MRNKKKFFPNYTEKLKTSKKNGILTLKNIMTPKRAKNMIKLSLKV